MGCSTQVSDGPGGNSPKGPLPWEGLWGSLDHRNQHGPGKPILIMERFCGQWWSQPFEERQGGAPLQFHSFKSGGRGTIPPSLARGSQLLSPPLPRGHRGAAGPLTCSAVYGKNSLLSAFCNNIYHGRSKRSGISCGHRYTGTNIGI